MVVFENEFDDFVRNKLNDFISPLPEDMWERIHPKKDRDRELLFFWTKGIFGSILFFGCLLGLYVVMMPKNIIEGARKMHSVSTQTKDNDQLGNRTNDSTRKLNSYQDNRIDVPPVTSNPAVTQKSFDQLHIQRFKNPKNSVFQFSSKNAKRDTQSKSILNPEKRNQDQNYITEQSKNNLQKDTDLSLINKQGINTNVKADSTALVNRTANKNLLQSKISTNKPDSPAKKSFKKTNDKSTSKINQWYFDAYGSPDIILLNRINTNVPSYGQFLESYRLQPSYTIGFRLGKLFGNHFSTKIGLQYSRINDKFSPDYPSISYTNHLNGIDIPLLIGYETGNDHFKIAIETGAIFNIDSWYNETATDSAGAIYKKRTGLSLYIGLNLAKKINEKISLFIEPYFRYRLSNMVNNNHPFTEKIDVGGISLGMRYHFKRQ